MKDRTAIQERYMRDPLPIRLGGIAANLARVKSFSDHPDHRDVVASILDESKFFIEWAAPDAELETQVRLVELQRQLINWQYEWIDIWANPIQRADVAKQAAAWSQLVLEMSGLLDKPSPSSD